MRLRLLALGIGLALCLPWSAQAAPLRAIVAFSGQPAPSRPLGYFLRPNGILPIAPPSPDPRRETVLEVMPLAGSPKLLPERAGVPPLPTEQTVRVFGQRLLPRQLLLLPGGTLTLRNDDQRPVTVELSPALPGKPSILLLPGQAQSIRLSSAGELSLSLREQPSLPVHVLLPLHLATHLEVSEQGTMAVATLDVPPGRYVVRLRVPGGEVWQQEVDVPADGRELSLKASLGAER